MSCLNVTHNALDCCEARLPRDRWCSDCRQSSFLLMRDEFLTKTERAEERVRNGELSQRDCDDCGEPLDEEIGEFVDQNGDHLICHAQCGLSNGWELA